MSAVKWYDLRTKQPRPLTDVLVTAVDDMGRMVHMLHLDRSGQWRWSESGDLFTSGIISHWMPVPDPAR